MLTASLDTIELSFNIDGLPLFKSSQNSLWPVLCAIVNIKPTTVFPVVLTYGKSKPSDLGFLDDMIRDLNHILEHGLQLHNRRFSVVLRCIVCDAPARAFVKGTKLCSGYFGCDKCCQKGKWVGRIVYPDVVDVELRTDSSFRNRSNQEHHHSQSPFCDLSIDMVKKFPIDYMHQVCLGVMKKLLLLWIRGKREVRISAGQVIEISNRLIGLKPFVPSDFARRPRGLDEIDRWKATEFRQFLLYSGMLALDGILREDLYNHFLCLSVAISILVCPSLARLHKTYAHDLLTYFVQQGSVLYGEEFLVYNVHSLIHLAQDTEEYGTLDACSAFEFENYMQKLKKMVRSGKNPIAQLAKRLGELSNKRIAVPMEKSISTKKPNNAFVLSNNSCCEVIEQTTQQDEQGYTLFTCRVYQRTDALFKSPCDSRLVGVYKTNTQHTAMKVIPTKQLVKKAIMINIDPNRIVFMALQHSM